MAGMRQLLEERKQLRELVDRHEHRNVRIYDFYRQHYEEWLRAELRYRKRRDTCDAL
jgi:hypothetical protein